MRGAYVIAHSGEPALGGGWNNQQLLKGCVLIPWLLHKNHGFKTVLVGHKCSEEYPNLKLLDGLELDFLAEDSLLARLNYVEQHAAEIDLLIIYGAYPQHIPIVERYKRVRPDGKIYLESDMNIGWAKKFPVDDKTFRRYWEQCDVIGATNTTVAEYMRRHWKVPVELIRNGYYEFASEEVGKPKENVILTVGRLGTRQKATHVLLKAFAAVADKIPSWQLRLVGTVEEKFKPYIETYFLSHPQLRERVKFTGLIEDRATLMTEYARAKIFCLTSSFEGTPNAATEALRRGCYVITSAIDAATDITGKGRCGKVFPINDVQRLAKLLKNICRDERLLLRGGEFASEYARKEFDAVKVAERLYEKLYGG